MSQGRFVVLPGDNRFNFQMRTPSLDAFRAADAATAGGMAGAGMGVATARRAAAPILSLLKNQIGRLGDDEALLVSLDDPDRLALQTSYPGLRIIREGTAQMAMMQRLLLPIPGGGMAAATRALKNFAITVTAPNGKPLAGVAVFVLTNLSTTPPTGAEGKTNAQGVARFSLPGGVKIVRIVAVPAKRYWTSSWSDSSGSRPKSFTLVCRPIDPAGLDGLRQLHAAGAARDGDGVTVAVIDGGASHRQLDVAVGENLTDGDDASDWKDNGVGHGTHVAGIIAAKPGDGHPGGIAPGVRLLVYRVYAKNSHRTGSFAVSSAIRRAVDAGADLINLSLTLEGDVSLTEKEIRRARAKGALCIAAAGNTADDVKFPARFTNVVGVAALGVRNGWPREAHGFDVRSSPKARGYPKLGVATFSCHGPEIDFAAPGVGVVSLMPGNSFGSMNGTSMAAPAITGLVARKLAAARELLGAARDQARSDRIMTMAAKVASSVGLPAQYQGHGVLSR